MSAPATDAPVDRIGIVGGSGLRNLVQLQDATELAVATPFAPRPVPLTAGTLHGQPVVFLQRHGAGHTIPPHEIDARANIAALAHVGCRQVLSVSAVGSLREDVPPGTFVVVDQFVDRTIRRPKSFFGTGLVAHVPFAEPTCGRLRAALGDVLAAEGAPHRPDGTYVVMEGPQFSTRAESEMHRALGATVVGMTAMPEAKLAREAQLCYALVAIPTDYDCWHDDHEAVTADVVSATMAELAATVARVVAAAASAVAGGAAGCPDGCQRALDTAIMTSKEARSPEMLERLEFLVPGIGSL